MVSILLLFSFHSPSQELGLEFNDPGTNAIPGINAYFNIQNMLSGKVPSFSDVPYILGLVSKTVNKFSFGSDLRLEDDLSYAEGIQMFQEFVYFDIHLSYALGKFVFSFAINNAFNFKDTYFDIEPDLDAVNNILFSHEQNFSTRVAVIYNF